tara:strand:- start:1271 stop:1642 length:372 start_codon:yes stop_codon:yes gene_type:complete
MKPRFVSPNERPEVQATLQYAKRLEERIEKSLVDVDHSAIRNVRGVEVVSPRWYDTNQQIPGDIPERVEKKASKVEEITFIDANPHQTGSTLASHENNAGGDPHPPSSYTFLSSMKSLLKMNR